MGGRLQMANNCVLLVIPLNWQKGNRGRKGRETVGELGFVVCSRSVNSESEGGAVRRCEQVARMPRLTHIVEIGPKGWVWV